MRWVAEGDLEQAGQIRLFCLPHAGSGAAGFYRWKRLLPARISVCPVLLPGREGRFGEPALESVEAVVDGLHGELRAILGQVPFAIFGHSMGALIAFSLALRLEADRGPQPVRVFCSGREAPTRASGQVSRLADDDFLHALQMRYGGDVVDLFADPEMRALFLPTLRADLRAVEGYVPPGRYGGEIFGLAGDRDRSVSREGLAAWAEVCATVRTRRMPGGHFYPFEEGQQQLLDLLASELGGTALG